MFTHLFRKVGAWRHEAEERNFLTRQAGEQNVDTILCLFRRVRRVGQGTTHSLQDQGEDVRNDKDGGIRARSEACEMFAADDDDA